MALEVFIAFAAVGFLGLTVAAVVLAPAEDVDGNEMCARPARSAHTGGGHGHEVSPSAVFTSHFRWNRMGPPHARRGPPPVLR